MVWRISVAHSPNGEDKRLGRSKTTSYCHDWINAYNEYKSDFSVRGGCCVDYGRSRKCFKKARGEDYISTSGDPSPPPGKERSSVCGVRVSGAKRRISHHFLCNHIQHYATFGPSGTDPDPHRWQQACSLRPKSRAPCSLSLYSLRQDIRHSPQRTNRRRNITTHRLPSRPNPDLSLWHLPWMLKGLDPMRKNLRCLSCSFLWFSVF